MTGVEKGGIQAVEGLILARYMMFVQVYFHHTRRAYDHHVTKALGYLIDQEYGDAFGQRGAFPPPTSRENLDKYLEWNDSRIWQAIDCDHAGPDGSLIKPKNFGCNLLLAGKAGIEPVDQYIRINESGHARRGPLCSNLFREDALPDAPRDARGGVRSLGRTNGVVTPGFQASLVGLEE